MAGQSPSPPSPPSRREILGLATGSIGVLLTVAVIAIFTGSTALGLFPRMRDQQSIRALEAPMAPMPKGTVPFEPDEPYVAPGREGALTNPVSDSPQARQRGASYYGLYCRFCHGDDGRGNTPVGAAYIPVPRDLNAPRVAQMTDGELCAAMANGKGHESVLPATVPLERRWYIVWYLRELSRTAGTPRE